MFQQIAERLRAGRKLVLLHGNADPDAVGSAYALYRSFPDVTVAALQGLDRVSKIVVANLDLPIAADASPDDFDLIVAVDTSSPEQLGVSIEGRECVVIDHHAPNANWPRCLYYSDETRRSCAEIVFDLLQANGIPIDKRTGIALMAGMLTDSGHFRYANPLLLRSFAAVMEASGASMDEVLSLTDLEPDISERIAQLKGAQRLRFERIGEHIVAISMGSAFEAAVCKALLNIGADVAFVGSQRQEEFRVSARARPELVRAGLHLGKLLETVGQETSNTGGGHAGAAGLAGIGDVEAVLNMCQKQALDFLRSMKGASSP